MIGYIVHRLAQLLPVLLLASLGIWAMIYAVPGGPVASMVGENATPEQIQATVERLGLDRPVLVQYWSWLTRAVQGDLGVSLQSRQPVLELILQRAPATVQLGIAAIFIGLLIGIPVAVLSALHPGSRLDRALSGWSALALGVPTFWLGILLILLFAVELRWLPSASAYVSFWESPLEALRNLALPALTLGVYVSGIFARFLRASLLGELRADYVRTARSKGLSERAVVIHHALRNAWLPVVTMIGLEFGFLLGGVVVIETVFSYPGIGRLVFNAINQRDIPVVQASVILLSGIFITLNLLVDLIYARLDPRVKLAGG